LQELDESSGRLEEWKRADVDDVPPVHWSARALAGCGGYVVDTPKDGDCCFHAFMVGLEAHGKALPKDVSTAAQLRAAAFTFSAEYLEFLDSLEREVPESKDACDKAKHDVTSVLPFLERDPVVHSQAAWVHDGVCHLLGALCDVPILVFVPESDEFKKTGSACGVSVHAYNVDPNVVQEGGMQPEGVVCLLYHDRHFMALVLPAQLELVYSDTMLAELGMLNWLCPAGDFFSVGALLFAFMCSCVVAPSLLPCGPLHHIITLLSFAVVVACALAAGWAGVDVAPCRWAAAASGGQPPGSCTATAGWAGVHGAAPPPGALGGCVQTPHTPAAAAIGGQPPGSPTAAPAANSPPAKTGACEGGCEGMRAAWSAMQRLFLTPGCSSSGWLGPQQRVVGGRAVCWRTAEPRGRGT
jgi:hypothetical protein